MLNHTCPECYRSIRYPPSRSGSVVDCPACTKPIVLPGNQRSIEIEQPSKMSGPAVAVIAIVAMSVTSFVCAAFVWRSAFSAAGILLAISALAVWRFGCKEESDEEGLIESAINRLTANTLLRMIGGGLIGWSLTMGTTVKTRSGEFYNIGLLSLIHI